jgi:raffinose/stachyose/melibiose transport system permease protein
MIKSKAKKNITTAVLLSLLIIYALTIIYPLFLMFITSLKTTREIFTNPFGLPEKFNLSGYIKLLTISHYLKYFKNSLIVSFVSLAIVMVSSSTASYILAKYNIRGRGFLYLFFVAGLIIPIRLGTISIMRMMIGMHLNNHLMSVIILSTAVGIPFGVFILTDFIKMIPEELSNAARIDGCSEPGIFRIVILPLLRPALAAVAIVNFIPIWNDFWFPLVLLKDDSVRTVPLATALLFGQYSTDYGLVFAVLSMASIPVITIYLIFSKQFVKGLSSGALKG